MPTFRTTSSRLNLCDTCLLEINTCPSMPEDVEYGDGTGLDNIIECPNYDGIQGNDYPDVIKVGND